MCDEHEPRLERWIRQLHRVSKLVRELTAFVEDLTVLADRSRLLVVKLTTLAVAVVVSLTLL